MCALNRIAVFGSLSHHFQKCENTGKHFENEAFDKLNYNQLVNQYRVKYSIPFPEQIIKIREKYNLSAAKMSEILAFIIITIYFF